ncbi:MAG: PD-(D/E)XK nuclease family protein [Treponema sp.]|jgi:RecB family exonuclease|nr:PD-(D/E)XK nuclease family protein [Treponema sp.]
MSEKQRHLSLAGEPLVRVSATDLNAFFGCSLLWFFKKILGLKGFSLEAKLLDDTFMGNLYHGILEALFTRIRGEDTRFIPGRLPEYRQWASKCTAEAAANFRVFQSPLASPLLMSQSTVISKKICALLETEEEKFAGYTVGALEQEFDLVEDGMFINGRFDRISISPDDDAVIIDYKFYHIPSQNECRHTEGAPLEDFQMALYIKLYEASKGISIGNGYFISILKNDMTTVLKQDKKIEGSAREQYQSTLDALEAFTRDFRDSVESLNFAPGEIPYKQCVRCDYRPVCRSTYNLNRNTVAGEAVHAG